MSASAPLLGALGDVFVARRPVVDVDGGRQFYELRYRHDPTRSEDAVAGAVLRAVTDAGPDSFGAGRLLVRVTPALVRAGVLDELPLDRLALDLSFAADDDLLSVLAAARQRGAVLVVADTPLLPRDDRLCASADVARLDAAQADPAEAAALVVAHQRAGRRVLAVNVETHAQQAAWAGVGTTLFQGLFLTQPDVLAETVPGNRLATLQLLASLDAPELDIDAVEAAVSANVNLSIKVLRYVNSAFVGLRRQVDSIRQAVVLIGPPTVRQLAAVALLGDDDRLAEAGRAALVRARFCDAVARQRREPASAYYTAGLLSAIGPIVRRPLDEVLAELPLTAEVTAAVLDGSGRIGEVVAMARAWEQAAWDDPALLGSDPAVLTEAYLGAISWVDATLTAVAA